MSKPAFLCLRGTHDGIVTKYLALLELQDGYYTQEVNPEDRAAVSLKWQAGDFSEAEFVKRPIRTDRAT